jgi:pectate lyase
VLLSIVKENYDSFINYRQELIGRLRYNGQIIVLENLLNNYFDNTNRGIVIETNNETLSQLFIFKSIEDKAEFLHQKTEDKPLYIFQDSESFSQTYDFTVIVPDGILNAESESRLKSVTYRYKLAGKRPRFIYQNGTNF